MCQEMVEQSKQKTIQQRAQELQNKFEQIFQGYQNYADCRMQSFDDTTVRRLSEAHQTGANCGCYATGMAIDSLVKSHSLRIRYPDGKNEPERIAAEFEKMAIEQNMSSIGEMFSAETLSESVNTFSDCVKAEYGKRIKAEVAEFKTPRKLETIIKLATQKGIRVLIPYYVLDETTLMPGVPELDQEGHVSPKDMYKAHWAVVSHFEGEGSGAITITLFEGHKKLNRHSVDLLDLYESNVALADKFDWNEYLNLSQKKKEEQEAMIARKEKCGQCFTEEGERILEKVSLRGKVVLIGLGKEIGEN